MQSFAKSGALVSIPVTSLRKSLAFYGARLGFSLRSRDDRLGWAELESDSGALWIGLAEVQEVRRGGPVLMIEVEDIEVALDALRANGVDTGGVSDVRGIARVATFEDPDRHLLMLRQRY